MSIQSRKHFDKQQDIPIHPTSYMSLSQQEIQQTIPEQSLNNHESPETVLNIGQNINQVNNFGGQNAFMRGFQMGNNWGGNYVRNYYVTGNRNSECCYGIKAVMSTVYVLYLYFTDGLQATSFVTVWMLMTCFTCCCRSGICCEFLVLIIWAFYGTFYGQSYPEYKFYLIINALDILMLAFACCICQTVIGVVCCAGCYQAAVRIKNKMVKKYLFRKYMNNIDRICSEESINDNECSICLNDGGYFCRLSCNHFFHRQCIRNWLKDHRNCPICRKDQY